jgi:hypothetical protein
MSIFLQVFEVAPDNPPALLGDEDETVGRADCLDDVPPGSDNILIELISEVFGSFWLLHAWEKIGLDSRGVKLTRGTEPPNISRMPLSFVRLPGLFLKLSRYFLVTRYPPGINPGIGEWSAFGA